MSCAPASEMVLSNKKQKQKLRAELALSQAANPDLTSHPHSSLKSLLDSATPKLRLSKREKRRKLRSLQQHPHGTQEGGDGRSIHENKEDQGTQKTGLADLGKKKNNNKKRKRKVEDGVENLVVKDAKKSNKRRNKKQKKTKTADKNGANLGDDKLEASELTKSNSR